MTTRHDRPHAEEVARREVKTALDWDDVRSAALAESSSPFEPYRQRALQEEYDLYGKELDTFGTPHDRMCYLQGARFATKRAMLVVQTLLKRADKGRQNAKRRSERDSD